jgi:hypothetical protein
MGLTCSNNASSIWMAVLALVFNLFPVALNVRISVVESLEG